MFFACLALSKRTFPDLDRNSVDLAFLYIISNSSTVAFRPCLTCSSSIELIFASIDDLIVFMASNAFEISLIYKSTSDEVVLFPAPRFCRMIVPSALPISALTREASKFAAKIMSFKPLSKSFIELY